MADNTSGLISWSESEVPSAAAKNEKALTGLASKTASFGKIAGVGSPVRPSPSVGSPLPEP